MYLQMRDMHLLLLTIEDLAYRGAGGFQFTPDETHRERLPEGVCLCMNAVHFLLLASTGGFVHLCVGGFSPNLDTKRQAFLLRVCFSLSEEHSRRDLLEAACLCMHEVLNLPLLDHKKLHCTSGLQLTADTCISEVELAL